MSRGDRWGLGLVGFVLVCALAWMAALTWLRDAPVVPSNSELETAAPRDLGAAGDVEASAREVDVVAPEQPAPGVSARWSDLNALAIEALEAGRLEEAITLFEECHAGEPGEAVFAGNLAEALARRARALFEATAELELPIQLLERAVALAPAREDLAALLARWKKIADAERDFWTDETTHFRLSYDGDREDILNRGHDVLTTALEQAYAEFVLVFNHDPVSGDAAKIKVVLYAREEFSELTGIGHWAGGVYDGVVRIPVVDFSRERATLVRVMRHELIHAFMRSVGGRDVPAWLNEGLAQWHEQELELDRTAAVARARAKLRGHELFPLEELRGTLATWKDTEAISRGYAQSLTLVAYIDEWYGERVLYEMVEGCAEETPCAETFKGRIGMQLDDAVQALESGL